MQFFHIFFIEKKNQTYKGQKPDIFFRGITEDRGAGNVKGSFEGDFGVENNSFYLVKNRFCFLSFFSLLKHQKIIVFQQMCSSVYQDFPFHQSWYQTYGLQMPM